jgi:hypothetical protein
MTESDKEEEIASTVAGTGRLLISFGEAPGYCSHFG